MRRKRRRSENRSARGHAGKRKPRPPLRERVRHCALRFPPSASHVQVRPANFCSALSSTDTRIHSRHSPRRTPRPHRLEPRPTSQFVLRVECVYHLGNRPRWGRRERNRRRGRRTRSARVEKSRCRSRRGVRGERSRGCLTIWAMGISCVSLFICRLGCQEVGGGWRQPVSEKRRRR